MAGTPEDVEFDVIEEGSASPYDHDAAHVQDDGSDTDA
jgi:hypothetical protein